MLTLVAIIITLFYVTQASFLQCSPSDSLESLDDLQEREYAEKQGVICEEWPFYAGGFASYSSSSSSSSSEDDDDDESLFPEPITSDSILYGFDDSVETTQCLSYTTTHCTTWVSTKKEDEDDQMSTEYDLCLCADATTTTTQYCTVWACLETAQYPTNYDTYSLVMDNTIVSSSSSSSSESESDENESAGDYYRFSRDGAALDLDESMELQNCWCKKASITGESCINWYCESLEHDEYGCHKSRFGVDDYGWFACYDESCTQWYGFLIDDEDRDEYRCECVDDECMTWICGTKEYELRRNYMWYNFWLALILWGCLCGCCGTKLVYKKRLNEKCLKCFRCRKCRMCLFYVVFGVVCIIHGGVPAFMFFVILSSCSLFCAYKCEQCKCCSQKCAVRSRLQNMMGKCDEKNDTIKTTDKDGENSKEESSTSEEEKVTKSGHIRVNSVDLDEVDGVVDQGTNV